MLAPGGGRPTSARERTATSASLQVPLRPLSDYAEERRRVTVVFADLAGSTELAARLDPEVTREIIGTFFGALSRRVQRFGGTVDKYVGDAVMAVFGAPVTHEDDAERALHTALAMRDAIDDLNDRFERTRGVRLGLRIGVNTGEVVAGSIAGEVQAAYTVVGDTVNLASRLQAAASPGDILVGASTHRLAAHAFELEPLAPMLVKGLVAPLAAYRLVRALPGGGPRLAPYRLVSEIVGRDRELVLLGAALERTREGHGGILAIAGDAGSGKSRLLAELRREAKAAGVAWYEGRCFAIAENAGYAPFVEIFSRVADIVDTDDDAIRWLKLERRVSELVPGQEDDTVPYLAALLGIRVPESHAERVRSIRGEAMGRQIFRAARRFIAGIAREGPVVLAIEDFHWADASTSALAQHVVRAVEELPLLAIGTSRPMAEGPAAALRIRALREHPERFTEIRLEPLSVEETGDLITNLLAVDDLPIALRDQIVRRAQGNPLYVEEIIRSVIEAGHVKRDEARGRWRAIGDPARIATGIPETIQAVILARVDRLGEPAKRVLKLAAVVGRSFRQSLLAAVAGPDVDVAARLAELERDELILVRRQGADPEWMFRHVLIQEAVYGSILRKQRREAHLDVAHAIERSFPERLEELVGALAYHYARADDPAKALEYLERAGDQAGRIAADREVVERYREAIAAYEATGGADAVKLASLERKFGAALFSSGQHVEAVSSLASAAARLGAPLPSGRGQMIRAIAREALRQTVHLVAAWSLPKPTLEATPRLSELYEIHQLLGHIDFYGTERLRLTYVALRLINLAERAGYAPGIVQASVGMGIGCDTLGLKWLAGRYQRRSVALAEATGDPIVIGFASFGLAYHLHGIGEWQRSLEHWQRGGDAFLRAGDLRQWGVSAGATALTLARLGDPTKLFEVGRREIELGEEGGDQVLPGWGKHLIGRALWATGDDRAAILALREAVTILRPVPDYPWTVRALGEIGICHLRLGEVDAAVPILEDACSLIDRYQVQGYCGYVRLALADAYLRNAERVDGSERERWLRTARRTLDVCARQSRFETETKIGLLRLRGREAWLRGRRSVALRAWRDSARHAEALGALYELGMTRLEIAQRALDPVQRKEAAAIFARIGDRRMQAVAEGAA
ncbi:MAG TPA: adenylate/guanylate cyclase domain-containing protein [Candidatus Limnocylindria bacterium]|nr:adenylate/guanylate cyclase domain-containing protein [Candidatus Limnocylindria bacterium]